MHEIVYTRADYEPWWMFDDWKEKIVSLQQFSSDEEAQRYLEEQKQAFSLQFANHEKRDLAFDAYWNEEEMEYCEKCEEDLQIFHSLIWLVDGVPKISF
ncbi:DUF1033 family protein [Microbacterium sp. APC 3898]|uniref:DUF1033 family protein n=2 Tax=Planococcus TaxID=1372 RepID=A0ABT7ZH75_9BACL|nr:MULTISPECIES: DUF1033 family protein [Terrabacteria group]MBD8014179.1 DUF1033 family protein [Planococcus wigleyi]MDN3426422.1 DUF1033 family protein [Planococcus sp. APC 4016]MDN3438742.1 DUF1033 family protein [Planococcus sp. APC 3900]MDN3498118.1 DUF1033 family protein [Microbacterium sp. APC 3898]